MRGRPWSVDEERRLRELVEQGLGITQISKAMGKPRLCVKAKVYNLGLSVEVATASPQRVAAAVAAATTAPPATTNDHAIDSNLLCATDSSNADLFAAQLKKDGPLPRIEEKLRILDAVLVALEKPGLSMAEIARLNRIIQGTKVYQEIFVRFVNYAALENEVLELRKQLASERVQK